MPVVIEAGDDDEDDEFGQTVGAEIGGGSEGEGDDQVRVITQSGQGDEDRTLGRVLGAVVAVPVAASGMIIIRQVVVSAQDRK